MEIDKSNVIHQLLWYIVLDQRAMFDFQIEDISLIITFNGQYYCFHFRDKRFPQVIRRSIIKPSISKIRSILEIGPQFTEIVEFVTEEYDNGSLFAQSKVKRYPVVIPEKLVVSKTSYWGIPIEWTKEESTITWKVDKEKTHIELVSMFYEFLSVCKERVIRNNKLMNGG